jgi:hypothetical protein
LEWLLPGIDPVATSQPVSLPRGVSGAMPMPLVGATVVMAGRAVPTGPPHERLGAGYIREIEVL